MAVAKCCMEPTNETEGPQRPVATIKVGGGVAVELLKARTAQRTKRTNNAKTKTQTQQENQRQQLPRQQEEEQQQVPQREQRWNHVPPQQSPKCART